MFFIEVGMAETRRGKVKWFNDAKGYGFIEHPSGRDVFVHFSSIMAQGFKTLRDGETVEYEITEGDKGLHAANVIRLEVPAIASESYEGSSLRSQLSIETTNDSSKDRELSDGTAMIPPSAFPLEGSFERD
jgi:cold shock protein